ncbi:MAG: hypothetical protein HY862_12210 [Chloroflexi bacterium]|nr:hypothetical protein [Chloroflexota bacterium]
MLGLLKRVGLVLLIAVSAGVLKSGQVHAAPSQQGIVGYYYLLTGFNGSCISGGGPNVAISGDFTRLAYLPVANSHTANISNPASTSVFNIPAGGTAQAGTPGYFYINYTSSSGVAPVSVTINVDSSADGAAIGSTSIVVTCNGVGLAPVVQISNTYNVTLGIQDGRLNTDLAAPVIVYKDSIRLFVRNPETNRGVQILTITDEKIAAVGIPSASTVLGSTQNPYSGQSVTVYRLPSGEFQLSTAYADGKPYIFVWNEDASVRYYLAR